MAKINWLEKLKIGNYLRELSVVIIGVAVTLYATNEIGSYKEKKDLEFQLNAIYTELEDNLDRLHQIDTLYYNQSRLRVHLINRVVNPQPHTEDSIRKYKWSADYSTGFTYQKAAFDMLVNSGSMKLLADREFLLDITKAYAGLEDLKNANDEYSELKRYVFAEIYKMNTQDVFENDIIHPKFNVSYNFHALNSGMAENTQEAIKLIQVVLSYKKRSSP